MKSCVLVTLFLFLTSCSFIEEVSNESKTINNLKQKYNLIDKSGKFTFIRHTGKSKKSTFIVTKVEVLGQSLKPLEQIITISMPSSLNSNIKVLLPLKSQYTTWLDGQRYVTKMLMDIKRKKLILNMSSPVKKWNGEKSLDLPKGSGVFCFYSQLVECVERTSFFKKAISKNAGIMNLHIIWEGFPYFQDQYPGVDNQVISRAKLSYNGQTQDGLKKFSLESANQVIMYHLNSNFNLTKQFWVSQEYSLLEKK